MMTINMCFSFMLFCEEKGVNVMHELLSLKNSGERMIVHCLRDNCIVICSVAEEKEVENSSDNSHCIIDITSNFSREIDQIINIT